MKSPQNRLGGSLPNKSEALGGMDNSASMYSESNEGVDLSGEYNIQSKVSMAPYNGGATADVSQEMQRLINGNKAILGSRDKYPTWDYQQTILTWKQTLDFTRPFELKGSVEVGTINNSNNTMDNSDGLAIAFHHDGVNYKFNGNYSSNLGIYNSDGVNTGIKSKAIVAEIDAWDNAGRPALGDPHGAGADGGHLAIMGMNNGGMHSPWP